MTDVSTTPGHRRASTGAIHQVLVSPLIGGAGAIAIGLAEVVRERGGNSQGWVPDTGPATLALEERHIPWHRYSLAGLQRGGLSQVAALLPFGRRLARRPIVHVHNPTVYGFISALLRLVGAKAAVQFHIDPTRDEIRWVLKHPPRAVITCSRHIASLVQSVHDELGRTTPVFPIQNAIDLERYAPGDRAEARRRVDAPPDRPILLMLANLAEHKGQLTAIRAVKALKEHGLLVECWLAGEERGGEGRFTSALETLAGELSVRDQIRFLGFRNDGPDLLRAADFFLLPSTHEGLPLSVLEAQSAGAIVLGSPIPGIREVVADGETGFLIDPADAGGYARQIAAHVADESSRRRIVATALASVRREHSWDRYVERTWQVYESLA